MTSRGLEPVLHDELFKLGFKGLKELPLGGVEFESNWEGCYRANLQLRTATRVILPILDFPIYQVEDLYHNLRKHDFTKYIDVNKTISVDAKVRLSRIFQDSRFVGQRTKDAIVDQFRERFGQRPNVQRTLPDLHVLVRIVRNKASVAIDTSGESLSHHGYRKKSVMAPLREHLAAGLLQLTDWKEDQFLVDPMCGSGTFLIEAALQLQGQAPGAFRPSYGFQKLNHFKPELWHQVQKKAKESHQQKKNLVKTQPLQLFGFDRDPEALRAAKENAKQAGVYELIKFQRLDVSRLQAPAPTGVVITNPPYGERLGAMDSLKETYADLSHLFKKEFKGWSCWLLSGNEELTKALHLKAGRKFRVFNGDLDCRLLRYDIF